MGLTWNKALGGGIVAPIAEWLVSLVDTRVIDMPDSVTVALSGLLVAVAVWLIPNAGAKA